ncbi:transcriptional regulator [Rhizobium sp. CF122]|uniref:TetR/AcrR family transcriptional regulator C-terminal domain-containing protein n=1 Tax=Rhizobium sp. CF122 TaxID=1144312 RepID=UPI000271D353|nr:TetR/AcrR family transcriptional regulator C-terminal domain-containing protein [Rhizobium sp. CF122]EJL54904.1 transcriptional regulator [Rhizobium sp. CF122]
MFQNKSDHPRHRGRPRSRSDKETRDHIVSVANEGFRSSGYANSAMSTIFHVSGISTKTMYRLFPGKAELLAEVISRQIHRFLMEIDLATLRDLDVREGLTRLMTTYGILTLSEDAVRMAKLVVAESARFPEVSAAFYDRAIVPTNKIIECWPGERMETGELSIDSPVEASGILRGMMIMEPQRASLLLKQRAMTPDETRRRASECVDCFLCGRSNAQ